MAQLEHPSLGAVLQGVTTADQKVWQFRGLRYANVPARFALAQPCQPSDVSPQCTLYGPRCPQNDIDFRHLLRIPESNTRGPMIAEDEFGCLNLDVTMPSPLAVDSCITAEQSWPVLVWIHGGSQTVTFGSSASGLCVRTSIEKKLPMVVVNVNYRLNVFAFGDGTGEKNLALSDQRAALDFVKQHVSGFGGEPNNITLAGESAGAVYVHAHMVTGAQIRQGILQSGSLYLSPPIPDVMATAVVNRIQGALSKSESQSLKNATVGDLLAAQAELGIVSLSLRMEPALSDWESRLGNAERLLIGDCEYESSFLRNGIEALTAESINDKFDLLGSQSASLKAMYGIIPSRPTSCKIGALDFLQDVRFTLATERIAQQWRDEGRPVFRYLVDEANPWQPSSRAHHAVDLPLLFGGYDISFNPSASKVSALMSRKWIEFIARHTPWQPGGYFAFGPLGECRLIDKDGLTTRRRGRQCHALSLCNRQQIDDAWKALAAGNISLEN